jgi:hypothetical protein
LPVAVLFSAWLIWGVLPAWPTPCASYELEPFTPVARVDAFAGDGQSTAVNTPFGIALEAKVQGPCGELLSGLTVTFTAPSSGASATFPNGASAVTNECPGYRHGERQREWDGGGLPGYGYYGRHTWHV